MQNVGRLGVGTHIWSRCSVLLGALGGIYEHKVIDQLEMTAISGQQRTTMSEDNTGNETVAYPNRRSLLDPCPPAWNGHIGV